MSTDLNLLKVIVDNTDAGTDVEGTAAWEAINSILDILRESPSGPNPIWQPVYGAIKNAYAGQADWGDE